MADINQCVGIKASGDRCTNFHKNHESKRCKVHYKSLTLHGPNKLAVMELQYKQNKEMDAVRSSFIIPDDADPETRSRILDQKISACKLLQLMHNRELNNLREIHARQIILTGVNPDAEANARKIEKRAERFRMRQRRIHERIRLVEVAAAHARIGGPVLQPAVQNRELRDFAADPQNIHTTEVVNQVKDIVKKVREVYVPEEYRWNKDLLSKTPSEILTECKLTPKAAWQLMSQYAQNDSIYDIEEGIYGKTLDSVWQFIKSSPDKSDLINILGAELRDNIGMCAQGNLSRICNVLMGYLDGLQQKESTSEKLGRLLPKLMEIEDVTERLREACKILRENNVALLDYPTWLEPLIDEDDEKVDLDVEIRTNSIRMALQARA
jgi:hypothetical protein